MSPALPVTLCRRTSTCGYSRVYLLDERRQQVLDGRSAGRDVHRAALDRFAQRRKIFVELVDRLDQRPGEFQQALAVVRQFNPRTAALEEFGAELVLQRLDLQRHRGLAQPHLLRRFRDALQSSGVTESAKLLQPVLFVAGIGSGHSDA